jgi:2-polyprenyl-6-methoxyphenol hydroxylase-like FAD-dependent oxidoreductase
MKKSVPTHVIVGGGTAGMVLTHCLLKSGHNVILIEQGSENADMEGDVQDPLGKCKKS